MIDSNVQKKDDTVSQPPVSSDMPDSSAISDASVSQYGDVCQDGTASTDSYTGVSSQKKRKKGKRLFFESKVYSLAIKCYEEQLPLGEAGLISSVQALDPAIYQVLGIKHYLDLIGDDFWQPSTEKPHYHIIMRMVDRKKRVRVRTILNQLNITFRQGVDDSLLDNGSLETVGTFEGYAMYLTHETADAIADGKHLYDVSDIFSNLCEADIKHVREGYVRLPPLHGKLSMSDWRELDQLSYQLGYDLRNYDTWYDALPFDIRSNPKMRTVALSYARGVKARVNTDNKVLRLCVFIRGRAGVGKTYASRVALEDMGKAVFRVDGGGTGKFDDLQAYHQALIVDDHALPNILNMADNVMCKVYRRRESNPVWTGDVLVVTSNKCFEDWLAVCGVRGLDDGCSYDAYVSRFYICHIETDTKGVSHLVCDSPSTRGTATEQQMRLNMFLQFRTLFDDVMSTYIPDDIQVDYSSVISHVRVDSESSNDCGSVHEYVEDLKKCVGSQKIAVLYDPMNDPVRRSYFTSDDLKRHDTKIAK